MVADVRSLLTADDHLVAATDGAQVDEEVAILKANFEKQQVVHHSIQAAGSFVLQFRTIFKLGCCLVDLFCSD